MQETSNIGVYTTVGERENRAYDSLQLSDIGVYTEVTEYSRKESKALKHEDYVRKRVFVAVVTVLTLLLLVTLTVLVCVIVTSKQGELF